MSEQNQLPAAPPKSFQGYASESHAAPAAIRQPAADGQGALLTLAADGHSGPDPRRGDGSRLPAVMWFVGDAEMRALLSSLGPLLGVGVQAFADASSFLKAFDVNRPGCIVVDAHLAGMNGLALQNELAARRCRLPLIMAIRAGDVRTAVAATRAGAFDVVERPLSTDRMLECIRRGVATCSQAWNTPADSVLVERRFERLSPREHEVLKLVVAGFTSRAIAEQLGLQEKTIEAYRSHLKQKMRARNTADLVRMFHSR